MPSNRFLSSVARIVRSLTVLLFCSLLPTGVPLPYANAQDGGGTNPEGTTSQVVEYEITLETEIGTYADGELSPIASGSQPAVLVIWSYEAADGGATVDVAIFTETSPQEGPGGLYFANHTGICLESVCPTEDPQAPQDIAQIADVIVEGQTLSAQIDPDAFPAAHRDYINIYSVPTQGGVAIYHVVAGELLVEGAADGSSVQGEFVLLGGSDSSADQTVTYYRSTFTGQPVPAQSPSSLRMHGNALQ